MPTPRVPLVRRRWSARRVEHALTSETELDLQAVLPLRRCAFDRRDVKGGGMFGDGSPVGCSNPAVGLDGDVTVRDPCEGLCDAEVFDEQSPRVVAVEAVVEVVFEPLCLVAPRPPERRLRSEPARERRGGAGQDGWRAAGRARRG